MVRPLPPLIQENGLPQKGEGGYAQADIFVVPLFLRASTLSFLRVLCVLCGKYFKSKGSRRFSLCLVLGLAPTVRRASVVVRE